MEEKDREVRIGENRMYLGEDNILYVTIVGEIDEKIANEIKKVIHRYQDTVKDKYDVLADLNKSGKHSSGARKTWKEMTENDQVGRVAMFGMHPVARVMASFVMGITRKKDLCFFRSKGKALSWLKDGKEVSEIKGW
ncbi:MAG: hypothetical protein KAI64_04440 [Thermoplasmata archaeon]|nr:hypothetical protein [Thermoplasmata archaeon]